MLQHLQIKDFTIIDNVDHELATGMTVMTGETGAGKSVIIDALSLIVGGRGNNSWLRQGASRCDISGTFSIDDRPTVIHWLEENDLYNEESECIIRRTISKDGRSRAYINGQVVPLHKLRDLCDHLINIHGQHENQALLKNDIQRQIVDAYAGAGNLVKQLKTLHRAYQEAAIELDTLTEASRNRAAREELLGYQLQELASLELVDNEVEALHLELKQLSSAGDIISNTQNTLLLLEEDEHSVAAQLNNALAQSSVYQDLHPSLKQANEMLQAALIQVQEAATEINQYSTHVQCDPERLQNVEQRLQLLHTVARKHQIEPEFLLDLQKRLQQEMTDCESSDEKIALLKCKLEELRMDYDKVASKLSTKRKTAAKKLSKNVTEKMALLGLQAGKFCIDLKALIEPSAYGLEQVEMLVTTNPGVPPGPLNKIASGGEISRIALALQVIIAETYKTPVLVFDEVDVGIGGGTAEIVGKLLRELGKNSQVLCITHLPQVASCADHHIRVEKSTDGKRTVSQLTLLSEAARVKEIARMLGGVKITKQTLAHAKEMIMG